MGDLANNPVRPGPRPNPAEVNRHPPVDDFPNQILGSLPFSAPELEPTRQPTVLVGGEPGAPSPPPLGPRVDRMLLQERPQRRRVVQRVAQLGSDQSVAPSHNPHSFHRAFDRYHSRQPVLGQHRQQDDQLDSALGARHSALGKVHTSPAAWRASVSSQVRSANLGSQWSWNASLAEWRVQWGRSGS